MQKHLPPYHLLSNAIRACAGLLLMLMFFIAVEKGFGFWDQVQQDQIELSENADADTEKEDSSEEDSDDFVHFTALLSAVSARQSVGLSLDSFRHAHFRSDVFTPPPEV